MPRQGRLPRITRTTDLPGCFDLKAYASPPLSAADWEVNLFRRLHHAHQRVPTKAVEDLIKAPVLRSRGRISKGSHAMGRSSVLVLVNNEPPDVELDVQPTRGLGGFAVEPVDMPDILSAFSALAERVPGVTIALTEAKSSLDWLKLEAVVAKAARTYDQEPALAHAKVAFLKVDLALSDKEIVEDFRYAVTAARARLGVTPTPRVSRADLAKLRTHLVLPYLDLTAWARSKGRHITNEVLAEALLGQTSRASAETVRKTIKKHATDALKPAFLLRLHVEALRDARRNKSRR